MARPSNAALKSAISKHFPATKFRVYAGRGTAASWTHIAWTDGPSTKLVEEFLATIGSAPGHMDISDYFDGERVSTERHISDAFRTMVARALLGSKPVPPESAWHQSVRRPNCGGYYNFADCVHRAISRRDYFEREQFEAHAWLEAWAHGLQEAPSVVSYDMAGVL